MKNIAATFKNLAIDSVYFSVAVVLTISGFWGLVQIDASLFSMIIFGILMVPSLLSTAIYLSKDLNKATHTLVA